MNINPKVVDLSHYDDVEFVNNQWIGFSKLYTAGYVGIINKVTQGRGMVDQSYLRRKRPAIDNGLKYGAYHYFDLSSPLDQAHNFLDNAKIDNTTLMALDHETRGVSLDSAKQFMIEIKRLTGRYPWLYSGFLIKEQLGTSIDPFWSQIKLWLSHYSSSPTWPPTWSNPTLWQFTGDGIGPAPNQAPGIIIAGGCDINSFSGTDDELRNIWAT